MIWPSRAALPLTVLPSLNASYPFAVAMIIRWKTEVNPLRRTDRPPGRHRDHFGATKPGGGLHDLIQHRLQIVGRTADNLQ